ncbi:type II toxin-antitoxin system HicA family toxin [Candidatus Peregrinibacteria bacterium]|nr:type II toxin-antitoxin system HicA family toxin [Candidatus Peregrinibacteria bacterium]
MIASLGKNHSDGLVWRLIESTRTSVIISDKKTLLGRPAYIDSYANRKNILSLFSLSSELIASLVREESPYGNARILECAIIFQQRLYFALMGAYGTWMEKKEEQKKKFQDQKGNIAIIGIEICEAAQRRIEQMFGIVVRVITADEPMKSFIEILPYEDESLYSRFQKTYAPLQNFPIASDNGEMKPEDARIKLTILQEISLLRKIESYGIEIDNFEIYIIADDEPNFQSIRPNTLCYVAIAVKSHEENGEEEHLPPLVLDRSTGELCVSSTSLSLKNLGISPEVAESLTNVIYDSLLEYFSEKGEDIKDLFMGTSGRDNGKCNYEESATVTEMPNLLPETPALASGGNTREASAKEDDSFKKSPENGIKPTKKNGKLPILKGSRVKGILDGILGKPSRIHGSHHVYCSGAKPKGYPVPIHGDDDVPSGTLGKCLRELGIREKFLEACSGRKSS